MLERRPPRRLVAHVDVAEHRSAQVLGAQLPRAIGGRDRLVVFAEPEDQRHDLLHVVAVELGFDPVCAEISNFILAGDE